MNQIEESTMERRRHARTQLQMTLNCIRLDPEGGDVMDTLHMVDISRSGLGAISDRPYYPGQRIVLCLPLSPNGGRRNMYARVIRCRPDQDGYRIGLQFDSASTAAWYASAAAAPAA